MRGDDVLAVGFFLLVVGIIIGGSICGFVSLSMVRRLKRSLREQGITRSLGDPAGPARTEQHLHTIERRLTSLETGMQRLTERSATAEESEAIPSRKEPSATRHVWPEAPTAKEAPVAPPPMPRMPPKVEVPPPRREPAIELFSYENPVSTFLNKIKGGVSWEEFLGLKGLAWVGALLVLVACAYALKEFYNRFIGPEGRLALGTLFGVGLLVGADYFRHRKWDVLFTCLTGLGIGVLYMCTYFSFHVYKLSDQGVSFGAAMMVTALAVVLAVAHDAKSIAIIGLIGGFLSPVLISTSENHPYALFTYIALLDAVSMGAAYYRRWRALDILCFVGTVILYVGWHERFYEASQLAPAMVFTTVFYLMFLVIPILYSLVRKQEETVEGLVLVVVNCAVALCSYYDALYVTHTRLFGFVVIGQALLTFLVFQAWSMRRGYDSRTGMALLIITLALVVLAVPVQLDLYGVALAWAFEGLLFVYLGIRFNDLLVRASGVIALGLSACRLIGMLPLHREVFLPVLNSAFGSWAAVAAVSAFAAWLLYKDRERSPMFILFLAAAAGLLGYVLLYVALSFETVQAWYFRGIEFEWAKSVASLIILWSVLPALTLLAVRRYRREEPMLVPLAGYLLGCILFLVSFDMGYTAYSSNILVFNFVCLARILFLASLWWAGTQKVFQYQEAPFARCAETAGHVLLTLLLLFEIVRWDKFTEIVSEHMALGLVSAAWAVQALTLTWLGLATRDRLRRYLGFVLFGVAVLKVWIVDTQELERIYRIVSFGASGVFMLVAAAVYHQYRSRFLEVPPDGEEREKAE